MGGTLLGASALLRIRKLIIFGVFFFNAEEVRGLSDVHRDGGTRRSGLGATVAKLRVAKANETPYEALRMNCVKYVWANNRQAIFEQLTHTHTHTVCPTTCQNVPKLKSRSSRSTVFNICAHSCSNESTNSMKKCWNFRRLANICRLNLIDKCNTPWCVCVLGGAREIISVSQTI